MPEAIAPLLDLQPARADTRSAFTHLLELSPEDAEAELERELMALELSERQSDIHPPAPRSSNSSRQSSISVGSASDAADLSVLHANLRERLRGFLAQKLGGRHVRVTVRDGSPSGPMLSTGLLLTGEDGTFRHTLPILVPAGERWEGRKLVVECELQLEPAEERGVERTGDSLSDASSLEIFPTGSIRVVSDLDDTVKHTQVLAGTRQILRNVFTRPYDECVELHRMWSDHAGSALLACATGIRPWPRSTASDQRSSASRCEEHARRTIALLYSARSYGVFLLRRLD